ncbi:MAG: alpha/beta hydrolase-fold protein [Longimonas sp.]|uniref:alpha/beta hydrolase n=1 Tax=Longimonas sp. TaxID=2039626 RepID=UPI003344C07C
MPIVPPSRILSWHEDRLHGRLRMRRLRSRALGISKPYYVYEAPGLADADAPPVLYAFRGHEREWVNMQEDDSRSHATAIQDIDTCVAEGLLPPMIVVMPGLNSANNHVPSLGINMVGTWKRSMQGLGSGQFWTYLNEELLPSVDADYPHLADSPRLMAGFSLGGYTVHLLAMKRPGYFAHAAMYDSLFMWPGHRDPRITSKNASKSAPKSASESTATACTDRIWGEASIFDPALGKPRDQDAMQRWNPTDMLAAASPSMLQKLRRTTYWIACAPSDGSKGNLHRGRFLLKRFRANDLPLGFDRADPVFHPEAAHTWHWTDRFVVRFLREAVGDKQHAGSEAAVEE